MKFSYRLVASSIIYATFLKNKIDRFFDGVDEEESTEDEDFGKIQSSLGKESVPLLMSENKGTKWLFICWRLCKSYKHTRILTSMGHPNFFYINVPQIFL